MQSIDNVPLQFARDQQLANESMIAYLRSLAVMERKPSQTEVRLGQILRQTYG